MQLNSILKSSNFLGETKVTIQSNDYQSFEAPMNFIGDKWYNNSWASIENPGDGSSLDFEKIPSYIKDGTLKTVNTKVDSYSRNAIKQFSFQKNGFEFSNFSEFATNIIKYRIQELDPSKSDFNLIGELYDSIGDLSRSFVLPLLTSWGKENGLDFDFVTPLSHVYRNTINENKRIGIEKAAHLVHVDFLNNVPQLLHSFQKHWKSEISIAKDRFLKQSSLFELEEYFQTKVIKFVNIWIPLNNKPTKNSLALMDLASVPNVSSELKPFRNSPDTDLSFTTMSIASNPNAKWVTQNDMKIGDYVIFNSLETPHTAVDLPKTLDCDSFRHSFELRAAYIKI